MGLTALYDSVYAILGGVFVFCQIVMITEYGHNSRLD